MIFSIFLCCIQVASIAFFNRARRRAPNFITITCLYGTVLEMYYLFHAESARNYLLKQLYLEIQWWPPYSIESVGRGGDTQLPSKGKTFTQCCFNE